MVDSFSKGFGLGNGSPLSTAADGKSAIARLGTPRASNMPGAVDAAPLAPSAASMPAAADAPAAARGAETKGLVRELASAPPVDQARVAELKAKIAMGAYKVEPERIASAMIASESLNKPAS
ncbi:MAG: flagellar biosynthesis anti-sigma factor FlgM [Thermaurantiacus sp.]